jgi:hypothetical protein
MNFRSAPGKIVNWLDTGIDKHFSNFLFVEQRYHSNPIMRRVFSLARKLDYKSLLIEEISESGCSLLYEENSALRTREPSYLESTVHRLAFFKTPKDECPVPSDFCGYAIYKYDKFAGAQKGHVYESVIMPHRGPSWNNFIHCQRTYEITTGVGKFPVTGVLYAQQNDLTFVCAHVALRTALSSILPEGDISYERINSLVGVDHVNKKVGGGAGLDPAQFEIIFQSLGLTFKKIVHEPSLGLILPTEFQHHLYGFVESGFPALMGFELDSPPGSTNAGTRHVIPVFGHTFNEDTWLPNARRAYFGGSDAYYPSENWLSTLVVHDDNFGPYFCLPRSFLKPENFRLIYGLLDKLTPLNPLEAEAIGFGYVKSIVKVLPPRGEDWYDRFVVFARGNSLVLRTSLVQKEEYLEHLTALRDWKETTMESDLIDRFKKWIPERLWMVEVGAPELFASSRRKFGELLLDANKDMPRPSDPDVLVAARLPGIAIFNSSSSFDNYTTVLQGHTALFSKAAPINIIT